MVNVSLLFFAGTYSEAQHRLMVLDEQCYESLRTAYRPGSYKNCKSQAHIYLNFCHTHNLSPFPADEWQMVRFARYVANTVQTSGTVQNYTGGVQKLHDLAGHEVSDSGESNFKLIIQLLWAELAKPVKQAEPMTPEILREIYNHMDLTDTMEVVCYTAILIGFYLFLRKSNLVPESTVTFNPEEQLTRGDLFITGWLVLVDIRWSKTIQYKQKELLLPLIPAKCRVICPIYWIRYMLMLVPAKPTDPLFSIPKRGSNMALTYDQLRKLLTKWVGLTGRDPSPFTPHYLR